MLRPVAATIATTAAVIAGILIVSAVRPGAGPSVLPSSGPGTTLPDRVPDLQAVGPPLALPVPMAELAVVFLLLILYRLIDVAAERATVRGEAEGHRQGVRRIADRTPRRLLFVAVTLAVLAGGGLVLQGTALVESSYFSASPVHLEGMGPVPVQVDRSGCCGAAFFRYVPGGTVSVVQVVRNSGHLPMTITGVSSGTLGIELRLFAPIDPAYSVDTAGPTYPFEPIELGPSEERALDIVFHLASCPGIPSPSVEPTPDLSGDYVPPIGDGWASVNFDGVDLDYSVLGVAQEAHVRFFSVVIVRSPNGTICGLDQDRGRPSPPAP